MIPDEQLRQICFFPKREDVVPLVRELRELRLEVAEGMGLVNEFVETFTDEFEGLVSKEELFKRARTHLDNWFQPSITCPKCKKTSHHPKDISEKYCGNCHEFWENK